MQFFVFRYVLVSLILSCLLSGNCLAAPQRYNNKAVIDEKSRVRKSVGRGDHCVNVKKEFRFYCKVMSEGSRDRIRCFRKVIMISKC